MESRRGKCISFWDKMYLFNLTNRPNHEVIPKLLGYEVISNICFCACHKNRQKHNYYFELPFCSLYFYFWTRTDQSTPYFFYFVWKEATQEPSRGATPKNVSSGVNAVVTTCFDK